MKLLLDTHIALWWMTDDPMLSAEAATLLEDSSNTSFVSAASVWEIAIKHALRRGRPSDIGRDGTEALADFAQAGFSLLPITPEDAAAVDRLPSIHGDPFDRLLLAQARLGSFRLVTHDRRLARYGDGVLLV